MNGFNFEILSSPHIHPSGLPTTPHGHFTEWIKQIDHLVEHAVPSKNFQPLSFCRRMYLKQKETPPALKEEVTSPCGVMSLDGLDTL